jgi:5-methylcytosine-specific restriction endonuclease McrA
MSTEKVKEVLDSYDFTEMPFTADSFAKALVSRGRVNVSLGLTHSKMNNCIKKLLPNKPKNEGYLSYILSEQGLKWCRVCDSIKSVAEFGDHKTQGKVSACRKCHAAQQSRYYYTQPEAQVARVQKRKRSLDRALTAKEIAEVFSKCNYRCVACGYTNDDHNIDYGQNLHLDHITPVSKKGLTKVNNMQLLCRSCNSKKGNR